MRQVKGMVAVFSLPSLYLTLIFKWFPLSSSQNEICELPRLAAGAAGGAVYATGPVVCRLKTSLPASLITLSLSLCFTVRANRHVASGRRFVLPTARQSSLSCWSARRLTR